MITDTLIDQQTFKTANGITMNILHIPGHMAGHLAVYLPKSKLMFMGDIDLTSFGPWYGCMDSDLLAFEHSIQILQKYDIDIQLPAIRGLLKAKIKFKMHWLIIWP